ncbi:MAG: D-glycero-beta-D-manno-heptose-7-phosphate kinase [Candidatus Omnitrophica bacterium]|nr:D-glycero-beta-D-manno-heptose-7-phosphate kinase [Candidatus Omnitrophota bacterium]MDD5351842.1 D-glycero-beta-D-manno-heptose-7-phosphate kinase [Candidatus Omnitrophota bacterium]MDD5550668.1 D-glycero-beta-D-manno-heptose-7-phosphate kinase [Candidatus Omnitrophota bacterium]
MQITNRLKSIISKFANVKILVIGDLILDEYIYGDVDRISPEAPVPVVWAKERKFLPGGAANVAANISSFGAGVNLAAIVGKDDHAHILLSELKKRHIDTDGVLEVFNRCTSVKTRVVARQQQIVRVDWENTEEIKDSLQDKIEDFIGKIVKKCDAVIIEDYGKGLITPRLVTCAVSQAKANNKVITVDPKEENFEYYRGVTAITPNRKEAENAIRNIKIKNAYSNLRVTSDKLSRDKDVDLAGRGLLEYLNLQAALITLGDKGMRLFEKGKKSYQIDTVAQEVFDVSGAGDTVIAAFTLALACGATMQEAATIANFAAGIVVGKSGVATTTQNELIQTMKHYKNS